MYYAVAGKEVVLLLCGGKRTQGADMTTRANIGKTDRGERVMKDRTHDEAMAEMYREDSAYAVQLFMLTCVTKEKALSFDLLIPNATTIAAIKETRARNLPRADSIEELITALHAND